MKMSRVLHVRNPLLALSASNAKLPVSSFFQAYSYTRKRMSCDMRKDQTGVFSFATFCTTNKGALPTFFYLSNKKCVPCNTKDLRPMAEDAACALIPEDWSLVKEDGALKLRRSWKVKTFTKGLEFFRIIADLAEAEGHHPDLHLVGWNNVTIEIWTHSVGGLTENDFILAAKINGLNLHELLRRKASD
ncbi:pterin-4-alpha-carbinolamine dehydratase 2, mitochondrial-like isoform X1 [Abrus precatorius]|uniref:4a-hydroxytetrahydrobiopterin dehydratase n=1 Tax=Abrus precatorius TaxID=3816 RepID=A0A8B8KCG8_ABRPR|nr:pterin-4-alpha-carbinolamine dehydratase 2, mitochondrial-like isoform X1 [Abrus precatorius]